MCDFGVSICLADERAVTRAGSREYMAPVRGRGERGRGGEGRGKWGRTRGLWSGSRE